MDREAGKGGGMKVIVKRGQCSTGSRSSIRMIFNEEVTRCSLMRVRIESQLLSYPQSLDTDLSCTPSIGCGGSSTGGVGR